MESWHDCLLLENPTKNGTLYKITNGEFKSRGNMKWDVGKRNHASVPTFKGRLCDSGWIHAWTHPVLACLLNPVFGNIESPVLWWGEGTVGLQSAFGVVGCHDFVTLGKMIFPVFYPKLRLKIGFSIVSEVYFESEFQEFFSDWKEQKDVSQKRIKAIYEKIVLGNPPKDSPYFTYEENAKTAARSILQAAEAQVDTAMTSYVPYLNYMVAKAIVYAKAAQSLHDTLSLDLISIFEKVLRLK